MTASAAPQHAGSSDAAQTTGMAFVLLAALGFAAVSTLTSIAIREGTSVPNVLTWRYVLASVVMVGIAGMRGIPRMPRRDLYLWLVLGGGGQALFVGLALSSIKYIPVATLGFLLTSHLGIQMFDSTGRMGGVISKPTTKGCVSAGFAGSKHSYLYVCASDKVFRRKTLVEGALAFR